MNEKKIKKEKIESDLAAYGIAETARRNSIARSTVMQHIRDERAKGNILEIFRPKSGRKKIIFD